MLLGILACDPTSDPLSAAQGDSADSVDIPSDSADDEEVSFHADILPLMERSCMDCHGPARTNIEILDYSVASMLAEQIASAVESGRMPPWQPDEDCHALENPGALSSEERSLFREWADAGAPEGEPPAPADTGLDTGEPGSSDEADLVIGMTEPYLPDETKTDDYRCFVIDPGLEEDVWVTGFDAAPGNTKLVHHVVLWTDADSVSPALDEAEEGTGYTCFGGPGYDNSMPIGGWVPGAGAMAIPEGRGLLLPANTPLVLQQHYYTAGDPGGLDQTSVALDLAEDTVAPLYMVPIVVYDLDIPAGESEVVQSDTVDFSMGFDIEIFGGIPHMHQLGTSIEMSRVNSKGEEDCLIRIPEWDFNLQGFYSYKESITIHDGDSITLSCTYDNSADNPNQTSDPPLDVQWGDGTDEEMCLVFAYVGL
jgi:hypothetical protein